MATPSHVDLSVLWVPIMPETSKLGDAMEKVGKDATESFGKGTSGLGDKIHESVTKSKDKLKEVFHRSGSDASDAMADGVKENSKKVEDALQDTGTKAKGKFREALGDVGKEMVGAISPDVKQQLTNRVEDVVGGAFKSVLGEDGVGGLIGQTVSKAAGAGVGSWLDDLKGKVNGVKDAAGNTRKAFADFSSGDTLGGVSKLVDSFDKLGIGVKDLPEPLQKVLGDISDAKGAAEDFAGIFKDLPGKIGLVGNAISDLAGPIGIAAAGAMAIWNGLPGIGGGMSQILNSPGTLDTSPAALGLPSTSLSVQTPAGSMALPGTPQPVDANSLPAGLPPGVQYQATQGSLDPFAALGGSPVDPSSPQPLVPVAGANQHPFITPPGLPPSPIQMDMPDGANPHPFIAPPAGLPGTANIGGASGINLSTIPIAAQKYANDCIDASARIILSHSGINMTEDQMMGVIAPGGTIDSQAAGLNRLNPAGGFKAMAGSGGSPAAMFAAIKASIDSGTGSVLNVAPGSSLAGRNFSEGHFIAATGYNPDGTINLSDTAGGTKYSVSASDAFQATRGRGIVAGTGVGPAGGAGPASPLGGGGGGGSLGSSGGMGIPTGAQHDPLYIMPADSGGSGGGSSQDQAQQLGSGFLDGLMQSVGLDGSVFKGFGGSSNPLHFGATKLATGLINSFGGMMGGHSTGGDGAAMSFGGGGGIPGLGALGSLIPGAAVSRGVVPTGPGGAQNVNTGDTHNHYYGDNGNMTVNGAQGTVQDWQHARNGAGAGAAPDRYGPAGVAPNAGILPPLPSG